ncbi:hypothetical protein Y032_0133g1761 [Ancylostoma ceylanicum]|uniref:Uncharacterized protein n=1 Tax=Ancylostoma ceylanicum TaxID=53326 RepID=A0A016T5F7_9BILA|nr:hypothetical protein Y032_0133g1761 [Ancylostoma ceylanicum]
MGTCTCTAANDETARDDSRDARSALLRTAKGAQNNPSVVLSRAVWWLMRRHSRRNVERCRLGWCTVAEVGFTVGTGIHLVVHRCPKVSQ